MFSWKSAFLFLYASANALSYAADAPPAQTQPPVPTPPAASGAAASHAGTGSATPSAPLPPITPPVMPKIQEAPLPPPVQLPPPPEALPADAPNRPLTADEAAQIALAHQPNVVIAQANILAAQGRNQQTRSGLKPALSVTAGYTDVFLSSSPSNGTNGGAATTGTSLDAAGALSLPASSVVSEQTAGGGTNGGQTGGSGSRNAAATTGLQSAVTVRQLLFDFNHTRDLVRQSEAELRAAEANLTRTQSDLILQVKQAFYAFAQDQRLIAVNEANVKSAQDQLALAQALTANGIGLPSDVVRAETALDEAISNLVVARNNASTARVNLALLMGIDPRTPVQTADSSEPAPENQNVNDLIDLGLKQRPDILQAQATLNAANLGVSAAKTTNAPSFSANLGYASRGNVFPPNNNALTIGASVSWDPFDGGLTGGLVKQARAGVESAQASFQNVRLGVVSDVSTAFLNMKTAEQRLDTAGSEVANAQESLRLAEGRYRNGVGTFLEVTDAQTALLTAQTNQVNARSALDQARAALSRAVGTPIAFPPPPAAP
jgi:outer membrane protein